MRIAEAAVAWQRGQSSSGIFQTVSSARLWREAVAPTPPHPARSPPAKAYK